MWKEPILTTRHWNVSSFCQMTSRALVYFACSKAIISFSWPSWSAFCKDFSRRRMYTVGIDLSRACVDNLATAYGTFTKNTLLQFNVETSSCWDHPAVTTPRCEKIFFNGLPAQHSSEVDWSRICTSIGISRDTIVHTNVKWTGASLNHKVLGNFMATFTIWSNFLVTFETDSKFWFLGATWLSVK